MSRAKATILCVHDRWNGLIDRKILLEENGYKVLEATDCSEGLRLFLSHRVDAVILDYQMARMHGHLVAAEMKLLKWQVPIILLSASGPLPDGKLKSVDTCLSKSQAPRILLSTLKDLLDGRSKPFFSRWFDQWKGRNQEIREWHS
ncbi:MAG: response regulator [Candidatus Sulfotelmatobacter sp.]